ncbi:RTA1 like protein-domain-containing protein [Schizothecium vesticola]|uniref:RTA1 like protein-domain-containing protein n=1 Tax=Schizothecium vesticola TaxID=314040 RepID=A0AA40F1B8_9PEZI|nr:RTA1 like protein-domain-containing protein [Schizothecium vesticola]
MAETVPPPDGYRGWGEFCFENPDHEWCEDVRSFYDYKISMAANATFLALFSVSLIGFVATYAVTRRGLGFTFAFVAGTILEILGYGGRIMGAINRWSENGFLMQICCLTIGPAFLAGGVYLCLRRIVYAFGPENSRIKPELYTRFFIPCDVISLVLQASGGALASISSQNDEPTTTGDRIMIAGLSFQVLTLLLFILATGDFALRVHRRSRALGADVALDQSAAAVATRRSLRFRGLLAALALATVCIFWRSVFRVAELSQGWDGPLMGNQGMFIGFEGVLIIVACLALNVFHPSFCYREMMEGEGGIGAKRKARKVAEKEAETKGDSSA